MRDTSDTPDTNKEEKKRRYFPRFVTRTIRNSTVKINGRTFKSENPLPAHLQGVRAVFGLYWTGDRLDNTICLWGSIAMSQAKNMEEFSEAWLDNPFCVEGAFEYQWWRELEGC